MIRVLEGVESEIENSTVPIDTQAAFIGDNEVGCPTRKCTAGRVEYRMLATSGEVCRSTNEGWELGMKAMAH